MRGGDIFGHFNQVHPFYAQPSLSFYLSAWAHSQLPNLLVLSGDAASPVTRILALAERALARGAIRVRYGRSFAADLSTAMCAQHLALSARRDGDQLHDGIGFLTAHVALSNAFERSLQVRRRARWCARLTRFFCDGAAVHRGQQPL